MKTKDCDYLAYFIILGSGTRAQQVNELDNVFEEGFLGLAGVLALLFDVLLPGSLGSSGTGPAWTIPPSQIGFNSDAIDGTGSLGSIRVWVNMGLTGVWLWTSCTVKSRHWLNKNAIDYWMLGWCNKIFYDNENGSIFFQTCLVKSVSEHPKKSIHTNGLAVFFDTGWNSILKSVSWGWCIIIGPSLAILQRRFIHLWGP